MKTIIQFITGIRDGGAETLVKDYATLFDKEKYRVVVLTIYPKDYSSANLNLLEKSGIDVVTIYDKIPVSKVWLFNKIWNKLFHKWYVRHKISQVIEHYNPIAIHAHLEVLSYLESVGNKLKGICLYYTCHSNPNRYLNDTNRKKEKKAAINLLNSYNFKIIALHHQMKEEINSLLGTSNTIVVHNGVDFSRFNVFEDKDSIKKSIGLPTDSFVLGHVGRFCEAKNHEYLVKIFAAYYSNHKNAFLLMIGSGPNLQIIKDLIIKLGLEKNVVILSHRDDIPRLLKVMDVFVFPSLFEGLPVSVVEAQVGGLRCLLSDRITSECFFSPNAVPLSIDVDSEVWANAIDDNSIKGQYLNNIEDFDMRKVINQLEVLYNS